MKVRFSSIHSLTVHFSLLSDRRGFSGFLGIVCYVSFVLLKFVFFPALGEGGFDEFVSLEVIVPVSEPVWPSVSVCIEAIPNQTIVSCGTVIIGRSFF